MSMDVHSRILSIYFFGIRKNPIQKISIYQTSLWKISTQKIPTWNIPTYVFKCSHPSMVIFIFFFIIVATIIDITFKSAEVFTFVKICQNKVLSEERKLMKWVGVFQVRISWVATFRGKFSRGGV